MKSLGFIGTGNLAGFFVEGLRRINAAYAISVSPRNAAKAAELRARFGVTIAADNQQIADTCDLIVVSLLPPDAATVLTPLKFRINQTVLSVMAGISLDNLKNLVLPSEAAVAMMPGLANAHNAGPSVLYPNNAVARTLLEKLGPVHVYANHQAYATASVIGAFSGMSVLMLRDAVAWFAANGLDEQDARRLLIEVLRGNATMLLESRLSLDEVARGVVTPGGITEQGRKVLDGGGSWQEALAAVLRCVSSKY